MGTSYSIVNIEHSLKNVDTTLKFNIEWPNKKTYERIFQEVRKQIRLPTEDTPVILTAFFYYPIDYRSRVSLCNWKFASDRPSLAQVLIHFEIYDELAVRTSSTNMAMIRRKTRI